VLIHSASQVGEPINPEAWKWYHENIGKENCPIVDTWWQTETGGHMITPLPGATPLKPGSASLPFFGVKPVVLDAEGKELEGQCSGYLAIGQSWPGQLRGVYGDQKRFEDTYFKLYNGEAKLISNDKYICGDACRRDDDGYYWITGRIDDVINVSGHRIGTAEVESALVAHPVMPPALCPTSKVHHFLGSACPPEKCPSLARKSMHLAFAFVFGVSLSSRCPSCSAALQRD